MVHEGVNVYLASGNYHIFSAVCHRIIDCPSGHAVLICFSFEYSDYLCNEIASSKIFDHVYQLKLYVDVLRKELSTKYLKRFYREIYPYIKVFNGLIREFNGIRNIYTCESYRTLKPIFNNLKHRFSTKIHFIEGDIYNRHNVRDYHLEHELYDILDDQSFFCPKMVKYGLPIPVIEQGRPKPIHFQKILSAFGYNNKEDDSFDYRILFFIAGYKAATAYLDEIEYKFCKKLSKYDGFVCKRHPNYTESDYSDINNYCSKYPWEVSIIGNVDTIDRKLLIGNQTGAMFHPKYVFDKEPYLVFTYKLYHPESNLGANDFESMSSPLIETYRNPNKIIVPETEEEMFEFIEQFLEIEYGALAN